MFSPPATSPERDRHDSGSLLRRGPPDIAGVCPVVWRVLDYEIAARRRAYVGEVPALRSIPAFEPILGCVVAVELTNDRRTCRHSGDGDRDQLVHSFIAAALDAGLSLCIVQQAASHADSRMTMRYDCGRGSLDRYAIYVGFTFVAGAGR